MAKNRDKDFYREYCTGCGLCGSHLNVDFTKDDKGFNWPNLSSDNIAFCEKVCPSNGNGIEVNSGLWGSYINVYSGWSNDAVIRKKASSGGVLTSICIYLLENNMVDGIIQTKVSTDKAYGVETIVSLTKEDVLSCLGSRYCISSPLLNIKSLIELDKTYAFVGKPCDVAVLKSFLKQNPEFKKCIKFLFSFFCAGEPSNLAQKKLLTALDCSEEDCYSLQYRGNGWPGNAIAEKKDGTTTSISYSESWGHILGRDVRKICRFCQDGIGEAADISCGDYWYLTPENNPNFTEKDGRNIVFSRTKIADDLIREVQVKGILNVDLANIDSLHFVQPYQYLRRTTMKSKLFALTITKRITPNYDKVRQDQLFKMIDCISHLRMFIGTLKRILQGKI